MFDIVTAAQKVHHVPIGGIGFALLLIAVAAWATFRNR